MDQRHAVINRAAGLGCALLLGFATAPRAQTEAPRLIHEGPSASTCMTSGRSMRRMLPERIEIAVTQATDLPPVAADAGAVQQMLLNLATNSCDAMPEGGRFTLDLQLATPADELMAAQEWGAPGHYVVLVVSDNGCGMDART